jgi:hypothetical protein
MSEPVPDIDELLFEMDLLHQQLVQKGMIAEKLIDSFRESLEKKLDQEKLQKVQRRIQLITTKLSTQTSSFANGGKLAKNSWSSPCQTPLVQSMSNRNLKQESLLIPKKNQRVIFVYKLFEISSFRDGGAMHNCTNLVVIVLIYQIYMRPIKAKNPGNKHRE